MGASHVHALVSTRKTPPVQVAGIMHCSAVRSSRYILDSRENTTSASYRGLRPTWALVEAELQLAHKPGLALVLSAFGFLY